MSIERIVSLARKATNVVEARVATEIMSNVVHAAHATFTKADPSGAAAQRLTPLTNVFKDYAASTKIALTKDTPGAWQEYLSLVSTFQNVWAPNLSHFPKSPAFEILLGNMAAALAAQFDEIVKKGTASIETGGGVHFVSPGMTTNVVQTKKNTVVLAGAAVAAAVLLFLALS